VPGIVFVMNAVARVLRRDERGATAVEYGLIVALIAAVIATVVALLGTTLAQVFQNVMNSPGL
jgi:pilus assembly protein Flp/PilA